MNELIKDIIKTIFTRLKQPSSAASLAVLISYMGIAEAVELSNAVCTLPCKWFFYLGYC